LATSLFFVFFADRQHRFKDIQVHMILSQNGKGVVIALLASNCAGTWTGTMMTEGTTKDPAFMVLTQDSNVITGTIGPHRQAQFKITKASLDGDTLTIEAHLEARFASS
jgi:hypothetical protein